MRASQLHRQNSAFVRSSSLGEVHASPVIQEVTIARGNGASRVIVKDGHFTQNSFKFPIHSNITITARLIGKGYFYATFEFNGEQHLAFVTPVTPNLTYTFSNEKKLMGLNFHISPTIPTHFSPTYMDTKSKVLLQKNPQTYNNLGFIPIEPVTDNSTDDKWGGRLNEHKWKYGHSGSAITPGQEVRYWANYDGGWIGSSSMYKYTAPGWECVQQYTANLQVGQPHCIVTQLIGYRDTYGVGGEYHPYTNSGNTNVAWGDYASHFKGANIRLMQQSFVNTYAIKPGDATASPKQGRNNFFIQAYDDYDNGGVVANNFQGSYKFPTTVEAGAMQDPDKYCAKVEWWNPTTNEWTLPAIYPPWDPRVRSNGTFAVYFRFPRQLSENDEFYDLTPQWQLDKTLLSYPRYNSSTDDVQYARIGRPPVAGGSKSVALQDAAGNEIRTTSESPFYQVMICPEAKSQDGKYNAADYQKKSYIRTSGDCVYAAVDPVAYSYADNPDIIKAYWKDGNFKPGGTFMLLGKALDMFPGLWVSTKSFSSKGNTPMDLQSQQFDMVRGAAQPNAYIADRVAQPKSMKLVNVDDIKKVAEFKPHWDKCFPGVPLTKSILTALLRGDQLPELEGITNTLLSGFLEDDPLRYETKYEGQTYKHSYTMSLCTIPEGWWGPTIEIESIGEGDSPQITTKGPDQVYIGGNNFYEYIKEEQVNLSDEIKYQVALEMKGYTAAEQFAASELENPMVDVTFDAYKSRNETVAEAINDQTAKEKEKNWLFRTEQVNLRHKKFMFGNINDTVVTDATQQYSADHHTSLEGISANNIRQYGFDELYLVQGLGNQPSIVIMPPKEPSGSIPIKHSNVANFGNSSKAALKARALGQGNPMKYSTEEKQDNDRPQQLGTLTDQALGFEDGAINNAITTGMVVGGIAIALGAVLKVKPMLDNMSTAASRKREARTRADTAEIDFLNKVNKK